MIFTSIPRLRYSHGTYSFEVAAHGLEKALALSRQELTDELNANVFYKRLVSASEAHSGISRKDAQRAKRVPRQSERYKGIRC